MSPHSRRAGPPRTITADLCVVGAGFAGLAASHEAARLGARVVLLDAARRVGGRARTVHPRWAGGAAVECGPEFVDANHVLLRDACARAGVTMRPVTGGELHSHRGGITAPSSRHPANDPAEVRLQHAYWQRMHELAAGITDPDRPNEHPSAASLDAAPITAVFDELAAAADAPPHARAQLGGFVQGVLGAEPREVSGLFVVQQASLDAGGSSSRVMEGLGAVAEHLATTLPLPSEVRLAANVVRIAHDAGTVDIELADGTRVRASAAVLAVPLPALAQLDATPALPAAWLAAAAEIRYGSLVKATVVAPGVTIPGWATASDLPTALAWQTAPGLVTTYAGASRADALAARPASAVIAQAAADVATISGVPVAPIGGTWRWTPSSRRGGCYAVFGPGQVGAHWDSLRTRHGSLALAGEHCGAFTGYVEGALQSGVRAARRLLATGT